MAIKNLRVLFLGAPMMENKGDFTFRNGDGIPILSPFLSYLIETDNGYVLVDTGMHPDDCLTMAKIKGETATVAPEDRLPNRLTELGLKPTDIDTVIVTHLHIDHIGYLSLFRHAEIYIQKWELEFALRMPYTDAIRFPERYQSLEGLRWHPVDGDAAIAPGITLLHTPGHSVGHQSVMVRLPEEGFIIIAGDAAFLKESLEKEYIPMPWSSARDAYLSIKKINTLAAVLSAEVFPGHDYEFYMKEMRHFPECYV